MIYLIVTSFIWAFSFGLIKDQLAGLDPFVVSLLRLLLSFLVFLPFAKDSAKKPPLNVMLVGALQFGLMYCLYIASFRYLKAYEIAVLTITTPLFIVLFDGLFRWKFPPRNWIGAFLAILGALVLVYEKGLPTVALKGLLLLQGANACFALGQIFYKRLKLEMADFRLFAWAYFGALCVPLAFILALGHGSLPHTQSQWLSIVYLGVVASGLGFFLWNRGVRLASSGMVAVMNNVKIPLTALVSWLVFHEAVDVPRLVVAMVCLGGGLLVVAPASSR